MASSHSAAPLYALGVRCASTHDVGFDIVYIFALWDSFLGQFSRIWPSLKQFMQRAFFLTLAIFRSCDMAQESLHLCTWCFALNTTCLSWTLPYSLQKFATLCALNVSPFEAIRAQMDKNIEGDECLDYSMGTECRGNFTMVSLDALLA